VCVEGFCKVWLLKCGEWVQCLLSLQNYAIVIFFTNRLCTFGQTLFD
jgi:hypothetical protein